MLEPFLYSGKQVQFWSVTGRVVSNSKRSDTYVSSFNRTVSSNVVVKQEFFLRANDGRELPFQLAGVDIPLRDGNLVTMIGGEIPPNQGVYGRLVVHDTGRWYRVDDDAMLPRKWGLVSGGEMRWLVLIILVILGISLYGQGFLAGGYRQIINCLGCRAYTVFDPDAGFARGFAQGILPLIIGLGYFIRSGQRRKGLNRRVSAHLDMLSRNMLAAKPSLTA